MSSLLKRAGAPDSEYRIHGITPRNAGWHYVGFDLFHLKPGQRLQQTTGDREALLVLVTGNADITAGDQSYTARGGRSSPFDDTAPDSVYCPAGSNWSATAGQDGLELALCTAPGKAGSRKPYEIRGADVPTETRGSGSNVRHVRNILPDHAEGVADSLIVVEVITPAGYWSSYPPHKHDTDDPPNETYLEETYYHRLNPPQGFAFQRVYTDDGSLDETMTVHDQDVTLVPKGYHPCGTPHGYSLYYLNVMAGPKRLWRFTTQKQHRWLLAQ